MTISASVSPAPAQLIQSLLQDAGVEGMEGIEVLRLVHAVGGAYDRLLSDAMRTEPVTAPRWRILLRLWVEEQLGGGDVNPTHLSRMQQVAKNTISDHLRALEDAGMIERRLDELDRRQFKIRLTEAGRDLVVRSTPGHAQRLNQVLADFTPAEIVQLQSLLGKLHRALCIQTDTLCEFHPHGHRPNEERKGNL